MNGSRSAEPLPTRSIRVRVGIIGGVIPVAIAAVATVLMFGWLPELPDPIAVHWSVVGADGFGPALPFIVMPIIITVIFSGFAVAWSWNPRPTGRLIWNQKVVLVTSVWLATLLSIGFGASIALQRGLSDSHQAQDVGPLLALAAGIGVVLAVAAWFALPAGESVDEPGAEVKAVDVRGEERVSWSHSARLGTAALFVVGVAIAIGLITVVVSVIASPDATVVGVIVVGVIVVSGVSVLAITNFWWRVSADRRGFSATGLFGWPRKRIPLANIRSVKVVDVNPTRDFGGWGWRWTGDGRSGIILRGGPGIEVTQKSGKRFVVTVDDAKTGAGVLAALLTQNARN